MAKNIVTLNLDNTDYSFRPYGTCWTTGSDAAKVVYIEGFTLCEGATVLVKFTYANTALNPPTLNINDTGAKPVVGSKLTNTGVCEFVYDGSSWNMIKPDNSKTFYLIDLSDLSSEYFYPVIMNALHYANDCEIHSPNVFGHSDFNQNMIHFLLTADGWSDTPKSFKVLSYGLYSTKEITIGAVGYGNTSGEHCVWLRGGLKYDFFCTTKPILYPDGWSQSKQLFMPGVNYYGGENAHVTICWSADNPRSEVLSEPASSTMLGGIKTGYTQSGKNYPVQLDSNNKAYVNVPWTDTKVTQTAAVANANYPLLLAPVGQTSTTTTTSYFDSDVTLNPSNNILSGAKVYESLLQWGNDVIAGGLSPLDVAMDGQWSANRLSFMPASDIQIEYSTDGGSTWTDYGLADSEKQAFVTTGLSHRLYPGKNTTRQKINTDRLRVTITASELATYFNLKKIYMFINQVGAQECKVIIERAQCGSDTTFVQVGEYVIRGWSGWNSIPLRGAFGGTDGQTANIRRLRFTYYFPAYVTGYGETDDKLGVGWWISRLSMIGETSWHNSGGSLAATGHIYSYDTNKNTTFPANIYPESNENNIGSTSKKWANIYAANFNGALKGNADTTTLATKSINIVGGGVGSIPYQSAAGTTTMLGIGSGGQVLKVSSDGLPVWSSNTTESTNSTSKLFLIGATSQDANPQTHSNSKIYATDGELVATKFNGPLMGAQLTDVNSGYSDTNLKFYNNIIGCAATEETGNKSYAGSANSYGFPVSYNANSMLWLGAYSGNYGHQLGFSSNGNIYMRYIIKGSFPEIANGGSWKALVTTTGSDPIFEEATTSEIQALFS